MMRNTCALHTSEWWVQGGEGQARGDQGQGQSTMQMSKWWVQGKARCASCARVLTEPSAPASAFPCLLCALSCSYMRCCPPYRPLHCVHGCCYCLTFHPPSLHARLQVSDMRRVHIVAGTR